MKNCVMSCLFFFLLTSVLALNMYSCDEKGYDDYLAYYSTLGKNYIDTEEPTRDERYSSSF